MTKNLGEVINNIMKENSSKEVIILTNQLQIIGQIHEYYDKCPNCHDCLISLKNVKVSRIEELCSCNHERCECDLDAFTEYDWFNICTNSIVGFSIIKN